MERDSRPLKELLADRYRIDRELGRGGFATVYRVWNPRLERAEALKVLAPGHEADEDFAKRFTQEVRLASALEHPSIVKVYDFGETGGVFWYAMQLVDGETLSAEMRVRGPFPEREAARVAIPLLEALEYSHARGIVHRDLKPENVILDRDGRPFLMDFGIAKSAGSLVKTQTGFLLGTPAYVAPEQAQGKPLDGRADLYALGVTLYKCVSGHYPFETKDPLQAVVLRLTEPPRPLQEVRPDVEPAFASIVMRALARDPGRRWESARAMREALAAFLAGGPGETTATKVVPPEARRTDAEAESRELPPDATVLGPFVPPADPVSVSTVARSPVTSALGSPSRRTLLRPVGAAALVLLFAAAGAALVVLRPGAWRGREMAAPPPRPVPERAWPVPIPTAPPPSPTPVATVAPAPEPASGQEPPRGARATRPAEAEPFVPPRPVTIPERLTPAPPFAGPPPEACPGASVRVGFGVDAEGNVVSPRLFPSGSPPECGRYVLEALPLWKWRPAADASGRPVSSARLVVVVQLP
jgi:serine/threonine-protein kinase